MKRYITLALLALTISAQASFYNQTTAKEAGKLPKVIDTDIGYIANPSAQQLQDAGWLLTEIILFTTPEGYVIIQGTRQIIVTDGIPSEVYDVETLAEAEARKAAQEAARIYGLAAIYGEQVGQFATLLTVFELAMPITETEAATAMYAAVKSDVTKIADSQMVMVIYNTLRKSLSDADIYAIGKVIGVAE